MNTPTSNTATANANAHFIPFMYTMIQTTESMPGTGQPGVTFIQISHFPVAGLMPLSNINPLNGTPNPNIPNGPTTNASDSAPHGLPASNAATNGPDTLPQTPHYEIPFPLPFPFMLFNPYDMFDFAQTASMNAPQKQQGLSPDLISKIPEFCSGLGEYKWDNTCVVCQEDLFATNTKTAEECKVKKILPCFHVFHEDCILPWFRISKQCPCCRFEVTKESLESLSMSLKKSERCCLEGTKACWHHETDKGVDNGNISEGDKMGEGENNVEGEKVVLECGHVYHEDCARAISRIEGRIDKELRCWVCRKESRIP